MVVRKANEMGLDRIVRLQSLANKIIVTKRQFPRLHVLFEEAKAILDIHEPIDLYVQQMYSLNAYAMGVEYPHVTVTTELVSHLTDEELMSIFGHELGHVKSEHVLYHQIGSYLPLMIQLLGSVTLGLGNILASGMRIALFDWMRKSELTADRAGLLTCQNPTASRTALCKLAGIPDSDVANFNIEELQDQVNEFKHLSQDTSNALLQYLVQMTDSHPWIAIRLIELGQWVDSGVYEGLITKYGNSGSTSHSGPRDESAEYCGNCGEKVIQNASYCIYCGAYIKGNGLNTSY